MSFFTPQPPQFDVRGGHQPNYLHGFKAHMSRPPRPVRDIGESCDVTGMNDTTVEGSFCRGLWREASTGQVVPLSHHSFSSTSQDRVNRTHAGSAMPKQHHLPKIARNTVNPVSRDTAHRHDAVVYESLDPSSKIVGGAYAGQGYGDMSFRSTEDFDPFGPMQSITHTTDHLGRIMDSPVRHGSQVSVMESPYVNQFTDMRIPPAPFASHHTEPPYL